MDAWAAFWGIVLAAVLSVFAGLAVVVTIGGFFDLKRLLAADDRADRFPADVPDGSAEAGESDA